MKASRDALPLWFGSRAAIVVLSFVGGWLLPAGDRGPRPAFLRQWDHWDTDQFRKVAEFGYFSPRYEDRTEAFLPGMPWAMRVVHLAVPDWVAAGLVVSAVAGAVACVALWQLAALEGGPAAGGLAVRLLLVFPYAVFLFAGYSEALFLAFAVSAWLAAKRDDWWLAGLLCAGASLTRVTGAVLAVALAVEYLTRRGWPGLRKPEVLALGLPVLSVGGYFAYLHAKTGHWDAYSRALAEGWGRDTISPVTAFRNTLALAQDPGQRPDFLWSYRAEIVALLVGLVLTLVLLWQKRWGEATFVGLNAALLSTSTYYASTVRALLVWFPFFLLLTRVALPRRWLQQGLVAVSAPVAVVVTIAFTQGTWLG